MEEETPVIVTESDLIDEKDEHTHFVQEDGSEIPLVKDETKAPPKKCPLGYIKGVDIPMTYREAYNFMKQVEDTLREKMQENNIELAQIRRREMYHESIIKDPKYYSLEAKKESLEALVNIVPRQWHLTEHNRKHGNWKNKIFSRRQLIKQDQRIGKIKWDDDAPQSLKKMLFRNISVVITEPEKK